MYVHKLTKYNACIIYANIHEQNTMRVLFMLIYIHTYIYYQQGKIEMEMEIVTLEEAQLRPAGKARDDPNSNPFLEEPK